jgi:hypothetical protein
MLQSEGRGFADLAYSVYHVRTAYTSTHRETWDKVKVMKGRSNDDTTDKPQYAYDIIIVHCRCHFDSAAVVYLAASLVPRCVCVTKLRK